MRGRLRYAPKNNTASGGKTERSRSMYSSIPVSQDKSWLQVEEKPRKKRKGLFGKKNQSAIREDVPSVQEALEAFERQQEAERQASAAVPPPEKEKTSPYKGEDIMFVEQETEGLRSTVAEIVDKYKKRSEEDEKRRIAREIRLEDERREAELRERRRLEEIRLIKESMSPEVYEAVESADAENDFDVFDDFSTEPSEEKKENTAPHKVYGVVFDPAAFDENADAGSDAADGTGYTEKI